MNIIKKILVSLTILTAFGSPLFAIAQSTGSGTNPPSGGPIVIDIRNPTRGVGDDLISLLNAILNKVVMPIATVMVVLWIIWAGFSYVLAQGNPAKIEQAHQRLLWSLIGAGILLGAAAISIVVQNTIKALVAS